MRRNAEGLRVATSEQASVSTVVGDPVGSSMRRRRGQARPYDFRRPVRLAREHSHLLRVAMTTFARQSTTVLTTSLRAVCQLTPVTIDELSYDEYLSGLPEQSVSAVLMLDPLPGKAILSLDAGMLLTMVDHQLGGPGSQNQPDRPLTDIEQTLIRQLFTRVLRELAYAIEPITSVNPQLITLESNAQFVQAAAATDPVVVWHMDLQMGGRTAPTTLCLPYAMLSPALELMTASGQDGALARRRVEASRRTTERLGDVLVDVSVRFDPIRLASAQVASIAVGDVLALGHRTTAPLSVTSASTTFASAVPGASGRRLAVLITTPHEATTSL
jgi:flagellar motor switch protein FliM